MKRRGCKAPSIDDLDQQLTEALQPGLYVAPEDVSRMVWQLEALAGEIEKLGKKEPARAVELYEGMIGACVEKVDELDEDESCEELAEFIGELFQGWIRMRQAMGADATETAATLVQWERKIGWGFELHEIAAKSLDAPGAEAYVGLLRSRLARARKEAALEAEKSSGRKHLYAGERAWERALREFFAARKDLDALLALCEAPGATAEDCSLLAALLEERGELEKALSWVDRGIALLDETYESSVVAYDLPARRRELLVQLGRTDVALADAWAAFEKTPGEGTLEDLLELAPEQERDGWMAKAMDVVAATDLRTAVPIWLRGGALERVVQALEPLSDEALERVSRHVLEPAAEAIEAVAPALAGRMYRAMGWRTLSFARGRDNARVVAYFGAARRCWLAADRLGEWEALLVALKEQHGRKKTLLADVQRLATKPKKPKQPSLLERGRARWRDSSL